MTAGETNCNWLKHINKMCRIFFVDQVSKFPINSLKSLHIVCVSSLRLTNRTNVDYSSQNLVTITKIDEDSFLNTTVYNVLFYCLLSVQPSVRFRLSSLVEFRLVFQKCLWPSQRKALNYFFRFGSDCFLKDRNYLSHSLCYPFLYKMVFVSRISIVRNGNFSLLILWCARCN